MRVLRHLAFVFSLFAATAAQAEETVYYDQTIGEIRAHLAVGLVSLLEEERMLLDGMETLVLDGPDAFEIVLQAGYADAELPEDTFAWIEALLSAEGARAVYLPNVEWRDGSVSGLYLPTPSASTIDGLADRMACDGVMLRAAPGIAIEDPGNWPRCDGERGGLKCTRCMCVYDGDYPKRCNYCADGDGLPENVLLTKVQELCTEGIGFCRSFERFLANDPFSTRVQSPL